MMGSTVIPIKRERSVKFHIDEKSTKPSIKITVSSDALAETLVKNCVPSSSTVGVGDDTCSNQQQPALIQIVGNCCSKKNGDGTDNPLPNGVLCNCANGDDKRTRITLDDYTVLEFPNCIDFGIKDFLCCKDEIELDLSSDTDASYLDATPPHRFSDSELDNQIEAMSITLDTQLNPFGNKGFLMKSDPDDDDEEEETTEESFIMDEEEVSSSASNSAATLCGAEEEHGVADFDQDQDHLSLSSSVEMSIQGMSNTAPTDNDVDENTPQAIRDENGEDSKTAQRARLQVRLEKINAGGSGGDTDDENADTSRTMLATIIQQSDENEHCTSELEKSQCKSVNKQNLSPTEKFIGDILRREVTKKSQPISRRVVQHPTKHFKRQISLPASMFMSYLLEQNNKSHFYKQPSVDVKMNNQNEQLHMNQHNCDIIVKNKLNRSNSCNKNSTNACNNLKRSSLSKMDSFQSFRSTKVIHGSTEDYDDDEINMTSSFNEASDECAEEMSNGCGLNGDHDGRNTDDSDLLDHTNDKSHWAWDKSDSFTESDDPPDTENDDEQQAFTTEVEKKSLILRHVRRLIRQDTTGNFAPPDFSI